MLCDKCKKRQATTFITRNVNGEVTKYNLCPQCAAEMEMDGVFNTFPDFSSFLGSFFSSQFSDQPAIAPQRAAAHRCPGCGSSLEDIYRTGRAGCPNCYLEFYNELLPSLEKIHSKTRHVGKIPSSASQDVKIRARLEELRAQLKAAAGSEEFEKAAQLRDEIKKLEQENGTDSRRGAQGK